MIKKIDDQIMIANPIMIGKQESSRSGIYVITEDVMMEIAKMLHRCKGLHSKPSFSRELLRVANSGQMSPREMMKETEAILSYYENTQDAFDIMNELIIKHKEEEHADTSKQVRNILDKMGN